MKTGKEELEEETDRITEWELVTWSSTAVRINPPVSGPKPLSLINQKKAEPFWSGQWPPAFRDSSSSSSSPSARFPNPLTLPLCQLACASPDRNNPLPLVGRRCRSAAAAKGPRRTCGAATGSRPSSRSSSRRRASSRCVRLPPLHSFVNSLPVSSNP